MNLKIYDDLIPPYLQDWFELSIMGMNGKDPEQILYPVIPLKCKYEPTALEDDIDPPLSFSHVLKSSAVLSPFMDNFSLIPRAYCGKENLHLRDILQARVFLTVPYETQSSYNKPHTDLPWPHTVCLYYVNDADGPTAFYDNKGKVVEEVHPKKGRLAVFDGLTVHGGGIPRNGPRCIINYDISVEPYPEPLKDNNGSRSEEFLRKIRMPNS